MQHFGNTTPTQTKAGIQIRTTSSSPGHDTSPPSTDHQPLSLLYHLDHLLPWSGPSLLSGSDTAISTRPSCSPAHQGSPPIMSLQIPHRPRPNGDHHGATKAVILVSHNPTSSLPSKKTTNVTIGLLTITLSAGWRRISRHSLPTPLPRCPKGSFDYNPNKYTSTLLLAAWLKHLLAKQPPPTTTTKG